MNYGRGFFKKINCFNWAAFLIGPSHVTFFDETGGRHETPSSHRRDDGTTRRRRGAGGRRPATGTRRRSTPSVGRVGRLLSLVGFGPRSDPSGHKESQHSSRTNSFSSRLVHQRRHWAPHVGRSASIRSMRSKTIQKSSNLIELFWNNWTTRRIWIN